MKWTLFLDLYKAQDHIVDKTKYKPTCIILSAFGMFRALREFTSPKLIKHTQKTIIVQESAKLILVLRSN